MNLLPSLQTFFRQSAPLAAGDRVVVAFSGGADSVALLWGMSRLARAGAPALPWIEVFAAHLDHGLDAGSAGRAAAAARLAAEIGVPYLAERRDVLRLRRPGESVEVAARRLRYGFLEEVRGLLAGRYVATAHHLDDQAETVLLRLLFGSGIRGLGGIQPRRGAVVRPLLALTRRELRAAVAAAGLSPVEDPSNRDLQVPRNRLRHRVLPALAGPGESSAADLARRLARLARSAAGAGRAIDRRLAGAGHGADRADGADFSAASDPGEIAIGRRELALLAPELRPLALAALHRRAGAPYPAGRAARLELERQLERQLEKGGRVGCDCGGGWRWEAAGERLVLRRAGPRAPSSTFPYTQEVPAGGAAVAVPERPGTTEVTTG